MNKIYESVKCRWCDVFHPLGDLRLNKEFNSSTLNITQYSCKVSKEVLYIREDIKIEEVDEE